MAYIIKAPEPTENYTLVPNSLSDVDMSAGAFRMYLILLFLVQSNKDISDQILVEFINSSLRTISTYKKELKELELLYISRIGSKYKYQIGDGITPAKDMTDSDWKKIVEESK